MPPAEQGGTRGPIRSKEISSEVIEECGLTVRRDVDAHATLLLNPQGPDGQTYKMENLHLTITFTNLANGKTLTLVTTDVKKDLEVTDNGDGTLTISGIETGAFKAYGPDGELLDFDSGLVRVEVLVDTAGTPDPFDDRTLSIQMSPRTGQTHTLGDWCTAFLEYIG